MLPEYSSTLPGPCTVARSKKGLDVEAWPTGNAGNKGRIAAFTHVTAVAEGVWPAAHVGALRTAALSVFCTNGTDVRCFRASTPPKKKSLFCWIGPPTEPPN